MITFRAFDAERDEDRAFVREQIMYAPVEDTRGIVAEREGRVVAAYVADSWTRNSCQVHQAVTDPLAFKHGLQRQWCRYVFVTSGRRMMLGLTPSNNEKAMRLNQHYGFREVARVEDAFEDGVDAVVFRMDRETCQYLTDEERRGAIEAA